jgi:uncharacterized membrane protein YgcG
MLVRPARFADTHHKLRMIDRVRSLDRNKQIIMSHSSSSSSSSSSNGGGGGDGGGVKTRSLIISVGHESMNQTRR